MSTTPSDLPVPPGRHRAHPFNVVLGVAGILFGAFLGFVLEGVGLELLLSILGLPRIVSWWFRTYEVQPDELLVAEGLTRRQSCRPVPARATGRRAPGAAVTGPRPRVAAHRDGRLGSGPREPRAARPTDGRATRHVRADTTGRAPGSRASRDRVDSPAEPALPTGRSSRSTVDDCSLLESPTTSSSR